MIDKSKFDKFITEELSKEQWKRISRQLDHDDWKHRYDDWFGAGKYRVFIPMDRSSSSQLYKDIYATLAIHNPPYKIGDYYKNVAINKNDPDSNRRPKITSILNAMGKTDLLQKYAKVLSAGNTDETMVVITRHPYDIAGMSTGTTWTSCMNLDTGCYNEYVPMMIDDGALAGYVVDMKDPKNTKNGKPFLGNPLKRILAVQVHANDDSDETALWVVDNQYPRETAAIPEFKRIVEKWIYGKQGFEIDTSEWYIDDTRVYDDHYHINKRHGKVKREPFKLELDEDGFAAWVLDPDNFSDFDYLNRQPDEDEYEDYYYDLDVEVDIYNFDRLFNAAMEHFKYRYGKKYSEIEERMDNFIGMLSGGEYGINATEALNAMVDWCKDLDEKYEDDYANGFEEEKPNKNDYENPDSYEHDLASWRKDNITEFVTDYKLEIKFAEYLADACHYNFKFEEAMHRTGRDEHPDQLELPFECKSFKEFHKLLK